MKTNLVRHFRELEVYQNGIGLTMHIFDTSKRFPAEEKYSLTDQMRRSSRSICANIAEAWRKRRYEAAFVAKLSDCEGEAAETQTWLEFAVRCGYLERERAKDLFLEYDDVIAMLVSMIVNAKTWVMPLRKRVEKR